MLLLQCACSQTQEATWQDYYDLGVRYLSEGNYEEAIIAFTAAIEIDPKQAEAYEGRGDAYVGLASTLTDEEEIAAQYANAEVDYLTAIELDGQSAELYSKLETVYIALGDTDAAIAIMEQGYAATGDERLKTEADSLSAASEVEPDDDLAEEVQTVTEAEGTEDLEEQETEAAEGTVSEKGDDSPNTEDSEAAIADLSGEEIANAINEASLFAWNWFWDNQHVDPTDVIYEDFPEGYAWTYEHVIEPGITSLDDLKNLTKQYFTENVAENLVESELKGWIEQDGALYVSATQGIGGLFPDHYEISIHQVSATEYEITMYICLCECSDKQPNDLCGMQ